MHDDHEYHEENHAFSDVRYEDEGTLKHRKRIKRMLEDKLDRKRLKEELDDELHQDEFDWSDWE